MKGVNIIILSSVTVQTVYQCTYCQAISCPFPSLGYCSQLPSSTNFVVVLDSIYLQHTLLTENGKWVTRHEIISFFTFLTDIPVYLQA
jgi:hypothetical protein